MKIGLLMRKWTMTLELISCLAFSVCLFLNSILFFAYWQLKYLINSNESTKYSWTYIWVLLCGQEKLPTFLFCTNASASYLAKHYNWWTLSINILLLLFIINHFKFLAWRCYNWWSQLFFLLSFFLFMVIVTHLNPHKLYSIYSNCLHAIEFK